MDTSFGLDFGTTNSCLSACDQNGSVRMLNIDTANPNPQILRSVLYFDRNMSIFCGQEAVDRYIDEGTDGRFMRSVKTFLPDTGFTGTHVFAKKYQIEDLVALIIRAARTRGAEQIGDDVDRVVLGRPVIFSKDKARDEAAEKRLRTAAEKAGFKHIIFQFEPIAAALKFEMSLPDDKPRLVMIGDFGGGTSDFTIMNLRRGATGNRRDDVLALGGVYIGGDSFDSLLMWEKMAYKFGRGVKYKGAEGKLWEFPPDILFKLKQWHLIPQLAEWKTRETIQRVMATADNPDVVANLQRLIDFNAGFLLFQAIERAKCQLSSDPTATISFENINTNVSRLDFEEIISEKTQKIESVVDDVLAQAGLAPSAIDHVFITGGSSKIPIIRDMFAKKFGADKLCDQDSFTSVAYGLGVSASMSF